MLPGWWIGENDGRTDVPFVTVERWDKELRDAGFSGTDAVLLDDEPPYHYCANMTSTLVTPVAETKSLTFLYREKDEFARQVASILERDGFLIQWSKLGDKEQYIEGQDVISTIDLEGPYFSDISREDYTEFMDFLSSLKAGVLWLTRQVQVGCTDPRYGLVIGLARTIRVELSIDFWTAELQSLNFADAVAVTNIARKFCGRSLIGLSLDYHRLDSEYSVRDGTVHIGRYHWISMHKELESQLQDDDPKQMVVGQFGLLDSLHWVQRESTVLRNDEVEVAIRCVGLNFRV